MRVAYVSLSQMSSDSACGAQSSEEESWVSSGEPTQTLRGPSVGKSWVGRDERGMNKGCWGSESPGESVVSPNSFRSCSNSGHLIPHRDI